MVFSLSLVTDFFKWWYLEMPPKLLRYALSVINSVEHQLSFFLIIKTFFKPWKGEYREGLVKFALFFGMFIKTFLILFDLVVLLCLIAMLSILLIVFVALPPLSILGVFGFI